MTLKSGLGWVGVSTHKTTAAVPSTSYSILCTCLVQPLGPERAIVTKMITMMAVIGSKGSENGPILQTHADTHE